VTFAPPITAPRASVTNPRNAPVVVCACDIAVISASAKKVQDKIRKYLVIIMSPLSLCQVVDNCSASEAEWLW
jgi:hypothetical protein